MDFFTQFDPLTQLYLGYGAAALAGLLLGIFIQHLIGKAAQARLLGEIALREEKISNDADRAAEREAALESTQVALKAVFGDLARESLEANSENFLRLAGQKFETQQEKARAELKEREKAVEDLVKPIHEALEKTNQQIGEIEKTRQEAYGNLTAQLSAVHSSQENLRMETGKLVSALRSPNVRGQWGEMTLRRLAELAGMVDRCDFTEQMHTTDENNKGYRPDMVIHLPEKGQLVVDVKTPLDAYLDAMEATDDEGRKAALTRHSRNLQTRVKELSSKAYYEQFERSPEFVILFVPGDQFLTAALDIKPTLLEDALQEKVLLITPTSFVALLKVVAYGWMQLKLADNAEEIRKLAIEMQNRLGVFTGHLANVGKKLDDSVAAYNKAVSSLESRVTPTMRRIKDLGADSGKDTAEPKSIDITSREIKLVAEPSKTTTDDNARPPGDEDNDEIRP